MYLVTCACTQKYTCMHAHLDAHMMRNGSFIHAYVGTKSRSRSHWRLFIPLLVCCERRYLVNKNRGIIYQCVTDGGVLCFLTYLPMAWASWTWRQRFWGNFSGISFQVCWATDILFTHLFFTFENLIESLWDYDADWGKLWEELRSEHLVIQGKVESYKIMAWLFGR